MSLLLLSFGILLLLIIISAALTLLSDPTRVGEEEKEVVDRELGYRP